MEFFRATVMPSKKLFRKAGDAFVHKNKSLKVLFIIGMVMCLVLAPVLTYISYTTHINKLYISPVGIVLLFRSVLSRKCAVQVAVEEESQ